MDNAELHRTHKWLESIAQILGYTYTPLLESTPPYVGRVVLGAVYNGYVELFQVVGHVKWNARLTFKASKRKHPRFTGVTFPTDPTVLAPVGGVSRTCSTYAACNRLLESNFLQRLEAYHCNAEAEIGAWVREADTRQENFNVLHNALSETTRTYRYCEGMEHEYVGTYNTRITQRSAQRWKIELQDLTTEQVKALIVAAGRLGVIV